ncbi:sensor histidine kinase [Fervidicella metallireducens]|uniref:sensor histidine kinase n=1 Tax=Fervidicella metallireducens TaxID=655338 RepID=UPI001FA7A939|nr:HAMP domain-containing sensor histidine kinase [Fervidicella metallireducens]
MERGLNNLSDKLKNISVDEGVYYLDEFATNNNVSMVVVDSNGYIVYFPSEITKFFYGKPHKEFSTPFSYNIPDREESVNGSKGKKNLSRYTCWKEITFAEDPQVYTVLVTARLQPIDEASKVLVMFMPYIGMIVLIVSVTGALIYSKIIAQPLIRITNVAKEMAKLNFDKKCIVTGEDEIGELSKSLNELSYNLQKTMTELKDANEKLVNDIEKERELEKKRREFLATISHELKTPITIIKGQLEGMIANIGVYKQRDKYLNRSHQVLMDMENMVKEILEISKIESDGFKPNLKEVNISNLINSLVNSVSVLAEEKNIDMIMNISDNLFVYVDEMLIKKAIANIINNAINHTNRGEKVYLNLVEKEEHIIFEVENTGVHIEEKELSEIFKPFYRLEKSRSRSTGGSGLGLYIVKMILDAHNIRYKMNNTELGVMFQTSFPKLKISQ